jgi:ribose 5-phosphate isomerase RpiB
MLFAAYVIVISTTATDFDHNLVIKVRSVRSDRGITMQGKGIGIL